MKTKAHKDGTLDVRKVLADLEEYENNPRAKGGLKINMPLEDALRRIAKARPISSSKRSR